MPRLPDATVLGERPTQARRQIASYTPTRQPDMGAGLFEIGASLADAQARMQERKDAVNRVREAGQFNQEIEADLRAFQDGTDVSDPESVKTFGAQVRQKLDTYLSNHKGSDESRLRLAERLEGIAAGYGEKITSISFAAQKALMDQTIGQTVSSLAGEAVGKPGGIEDYFARLDSTIDDLEPALSKQAADQARAAGRGEILKSAISGLIERGGHKEARELLTTLPNASTYLSPEDQRTINAGIIKGEMAEARARADAEKKLTELRVILGREPTAAERIRAAGVAAPQGPQTLSSKIRDFEQTMGRPATATELAKISGTYVPPAEQKQTLAQKVAEFEEVMGRPASEAERKKLAGAFTDTNQRTTLNDKISEFEEAAGRKATPDEFAKLAGTFVAEKSDKPTLAGRIAEFESAVNRPATEQEKAKLANAFIAPPKPEAVGFGNSITGRALDILTNDAPAYAAGLLSPEEERRFMSAVTQYTQPTTVPNPVTGILETKAPKLPAFVAQALQQRGIAVPTDQPPQGGMPGGMPGVGGTPGQVPSVAGPNDGRPNQPRTTAEAAMGGKTIFQMSSDIAGPVPAIGEALSRTPGIGLVVQTPDFIQARRFAELASNDLVRVLQNNPRFAEGERKQIKEELSIDPKLFDTPDAFRNRLIAVDDALAIRAADAFKTINAPGISLEERRRAIDNLNAINNFRQNLGVPPLVKTADEARKLPPGTIFRNPQGAILQVPNG